MNEQKRAWLKAWLRRALFAVFVVLVLSILTYEGLRETQRAQLLRVGSRAPDFRAERYGGGTVSLGQLSGQVVMLDFWATWCPPCVEEMPVLAKLAEEYKNQNFVFVAANQIESDSKAHVGVFLAQRLPEKLPQNMLVVFAPDEVFHRYAVHVLPTLFFIGRDGTVRQVHQGQASENQLRAWIEEALAEPSAR